MLRADSSTVPDYEHQASSTVAMAVELDVRTEPLGGSAEALINIVPQVPILATRRMRAAYGYIDDDRAVVTRPAAMSEVQALMALRTHSLRYFVEQEADGAAAPALPVGALVSDIRDMLHRGWVRDPSDLRRYKERLWRANEEVVRRPRELARGTGRREAVFHVFNAQDNTVAARLSKSGRGRISRHNSC